MNAIYPGTFEETLNATFKDNNIPSMKMLHDPPSTEVLNKILKSDLPLNIPNIPIPTTVQETEENIIPQHNQDYPNHEDSNKTLKPTTSTDTIKQNSKNNRLQSPPSGQQPGNNKQKPQIGSKPK